MTSTSSSRPTETISFLELVLSPDFRADPYPGWARLRATSPVHHTELGAWVLTRHEDVTTILRDPRTSTDATNAALFEQYEDGQGSSARMFGDLDEGEEDARPILFTDPPEHTHLRRLVSHAFTPRTVEALTPRIEQLVDGLLDDLAARGGVVDLVEDYAYPIPVTVICEMMGVPTADHETFAGWSRILAASIDPVVLRSAEQEAEIQATIDLFAAYFEKLIEQRRADPGDDVLSSLIATEEDGESLTHGQLIAQAMFLLVAGHETTVNLVSNGVRALLAHPDQLARLRDDPALDKVATEEMLRYDSPVQFSMRIAMADMEFSGVSIPEGSVILAIIGAANRDPEVFDGPDRLDVTRADNRHIGFGGGAHFCLGAPLARLEGRIAITRLIRRFPELALAGEPVARETFTLRGLSRLPVTLS